MQIFGGLIVVLIGAGLAIKTEWFVENFGRITWFEDNLGTEGGTRLGYKLLGILAVFIGIIVMTGSGGLFFGWLFSPLTRYMQPK
jgi:hypothetical protein